METSGWAPLGWLGKLRLERVCRGALGRRLWLGARGDEPELGWGAWCGDSSAWECAGPGGVRFPLPKPGPWGAASADLAGARRWGWRASGRFLGEEPQHHHSSVELQWGEG